MRINNLNIDAMKVLEIMCINTGYSLQKQATIILENALYDFYEDLGEDQKIEFLTGQFFKGSSK